MLRVGVGVVGGLFRGLSGGEWTGKRIGARGIRERDSRSTAMTVSHHPPTHQPTHPPTQHQRTRVPRKLLAWGMAPDRILERPKSMILTSASGPRCVRRRFSGVEWGGS